MARRKTKADMLREEIAANDARLAAACVENAKLHESSMIAIGSLGVAIEEHQRTVSNPEFRKAKDSAMRKAVIAAERREQERKKAELEETKKLPSVGGDLAVDHG